MYPHAVNPLVVYPACGYEGFPRPAVHYSLTGNPRAIPWVPLNRVGYPSGQREQTVNLSSQTSKVRILPPPFLSQLAFFHPPSLMNALAISRPEALIWHTQAGVTQLARVIAFQAMGRGFESRLPLYSCFAQPGDVTRDTSTLISIVCFQSRSYLPST